MKKFIITLILFIASVSCTFAGYAPGDPPCVPQYPYYMGADKTRDQVKYYWYNNWFWQASWPGRQANCQDWFYIWQPANNFLGYWQPAGYVWLSDSSQQGQVVTITGFTAQGQVKLSMMRPWYDNELNAIISQTATLLNNRGVWWTWWNN